MPQLTYAVQVDTKRTGNFAAALDDLTPYVTALRWRSGLDAPHGQLAPPAQAEVELVNADGLFDLATSGENLLTNSDFSAWTGNTPDGWSVFNAAPPTAEVTPVNSAGLHGSASATPLAANLFWSSGAPLRLDQAVLTVGQIYRVTFTISHIAAGGGVFVVNNATRVSPVYYTVGEKSCTFQAEIGVRVGLQATNFTTALPVDVTITQISVVAVSRAALLQPGQLLRISSTDNYGIGLPQARTTFWLGRLSALHQQLDPQSGRLDGHTLRLVAECPTRDLLEAEYSPPLLLDSTADQALLPLFESGLAVWPYASSYWLLEAESTSRLGYETVLPLTENIRLLETGETVFPVLGDASERGQGVSALAYVQDLVAAELGRFFWDARLGAFVLHSRNHDSLDPTPLLTLTGADLSGGLTLSSGGGLVNVVTVDYLARERGAAGSVVWQLRSAPLRLQPGESRTLTAHFNDPAQPAERCAVLDGLPPAPQTDWYAQRATLTGWEDASAWVTLAVEWSAFSAQVTFLNQSNWIVEVQTAQLRGTPLYSQRQSVTVSDAESIRASGRRQRPPLEVRAVADAETAEQLARYHLATRADPAPVLRQVQFEAPHSAALLNALFAGSIGMRLRVQDAASGHDQDYILVGEAHAVQADTRRHTVEWLLKPCARTVFWRLDLPALARLGSATRLAW